MIDRKDLEVVLIKLRLSKDNFHISFRHTRYRNILTATILKLDGEKDYTVYYDVCVINDNTGDFLHSEHVDTLTEALNVIEREGVLSVSYEFIDYA